MTKPHHVAIIMDGNRRWAKNKGMNAEQGHQEGAKALMNLCKNFAQFQIPFLTVYAFSIENNRRNNHEKQKLFSMLEEHLNKDIKSLQKENIKVQFIGDFSIFSPKIQEKIQEINGNIQKHFHYTLTIALNYGGRQEIANAINIAVSKNLQINEEEISKIINQKTPDVDLLIRTGGMQRTSNFMLWQASYAELYFEKALWPEFSITHLQNALDFFTQQKRNFGS